MDQPHAKGETVTVLSILRTEHRRIGALLDQYDGTADPTARQGIADNAVAEIETHTLLEEDIVHPVARRVVRDESHIGSLEAGHRSADKAAEELAEEEPGSDAFDALFRELAGHFRRHVQEGEAVFRELETLGDEELVELGRKLEEHREKSLHAIQKHGPHAPADVQSHAD
jgi:hypothetical protein